MPGDLGLALASGNKQVWLGSRVLEVQLQYNLGRSVVTAARCMWTPKAAGRDPSILW